MAGAKRRDNSQQKPKPKSIFQNKTVRITIIVVSLILFIVIVVFTIKAYQKYFVDTLKISREVFLSTPQLISLENNNQLNKNAVDPIGPCYTFTINGYTFAIPESFTPVKIDYNSAEFRKRSKLGGIYIFLRAEPKTKTIYFNSKGIYKWFLPREMRYFMPLVLNSTIHPIRLMFKAQLFASEGISSLIFKAYWDKNHIGYIFPTPGKEGYFARIFRMDKNNGGTVEFILSNSIEPVPLTDWVDYAKKIKMSMLDADSISNLSQESSIYSLDDLIEQASDDTQQRKTLSIGLSEFFRTKNAEWLIPVAIVMQNRGFFPEVLDLIEDYKTEFDEESKYYSKWNEIIDKAVADSVAIEIDPLINLKEMNIYCKNLTDFDIEKLKLNISVISKFGNVQSFNISLLSQSSLLSRDEKKLIIKCPADISLSNAAEIKYRVTNLEFARR